MSSVIFAVGERVGNLTVIECLGLQRRYMRWRCACSCGSERIVRSDQLSRARRDAVSMTCAKCAAALAGRAKRTHGASKTRIFAVWRAMVARCHKPGSSSYEKYGARGVRVCREWTDFATFREWSLRSGYGDGLSIDRIDSDGNYEPSNCRWIPLSENGYRAAMKRWRP